MSVQTPGLLDTIEVFEDKDCDDPLGSEDAKIEVEAVGLNFCDVLAALGKVDLYAGLEAAGVVT